MLRIESPHDGDVLNRFDGVEGVCGLRIRVTGTCRADARVMVNGVRATVTGGGFHAELTLSEHKTAIVAGDGESASTVVVLYAANSRPRYRFSLDDNIWFLRDIAANRHNSIFENPYMALWKRLHDTHGTKINCNIYFQCEDFDLGKFPDTYKSEWQDNADWFRMTFHALQNEPSKLYIAAGYDQVAHDFELVTNEILRFAGDEVLNTFTTIHWGEATREGCRAVRERGVRGLCGYFRLGADGEPAVSYYADRTTTEHLAGRDAWMDWAEDILFVKHDLVINSGAMDRIVPVLEEAAADPHRRDMMEIMIHEQYFYPDYRAYLPDYEQRCETTVRWMHEHDYQPVFWSDGFLGLPTA